MGYSYLLFIQTISPDSDWVRLQPSQEKLKAMPMQNFRGQIRCTMGIVEVRIRLDFSSF